MCEHLDNVVCKHQGNMFGNWSAVNTNKAFHKEMMVLTGP